jgi:hypothetical protein
MSTTATESVHDVDPFVDRVRYPLDQPDHPGYAELVDRARDQLAASGASELDGFLTRAGLSAMVADAVDLEPQAFHSGGPGTAYLGLPDESLPEDHPRRYWGDYGVGAVAYDQFPTGSPIRGLYEWPPLVRFLTEVLGRGSIYPYADPLGALNLATMGAGDQLQWHFDQTDFVVSLALRDAEMGGDFEVVPRIRSQNDENYDQVAALLAGDTTDLVTLPMVPGTLLIFEGRHSIHRVSPIGGTTSRLVALLGYDTKPDAMSSELLKLVRYGRSETPT